MSHFSEVTTAPADPILGLTEAFKADPSPEKINLGVGVFVDATGKTPILETVREAEKRIIAQNQSKSYIGITGQASYSKLAQKLCFGKEFAERLSGRIVSAQSVGGTGGLRVAADFFHKNLKAPTVWLSNPTWANHKGVFSAGGLTTKSYAYFDAASGTVDFNAFLSSINLIPEGDVVVLHACCHNPTGADLNADQWAIVAEMAKENDWIPFIDFAYQGFGNGIFEDAVAVRTMAEAGVEFGVAQSFSKNFGLYQDRIGALHLVLNSKEVADKVASQLKISIRTNYSNPPAHGAAIVNTILSDAGLSTEWEKEVTAMRNRINGVRNEFVEALKTAGVSKDFSFLNDQRGMFSFTGIERDHVIRLRDEFAIYMVESGRINVAGITPSNLSPLVRAIKAVLG